MTQIKPCISGRPIAPGPWDNEPDRVEFMHAGLPCLLQRAMHVGSWCGYAAVPPGHPLHGVDYETADERGIEAHGGLTYAKACRGEICHVPQPGEPDDVWWFGFDCAHGGDLVPAFPCFDGDQYRDLAYVEAEVRRLAEQLASVR